MSSKSTRHVLEVAAGNVKLEGAHELRAYAIITDGAADVVVTWHENASGAVSRLIWEDQVVGADLAKTRSFPSDPRERPFSTDDMVITITGANSYVIFYTGAGG